jgi:hypothetical protein
MTTYLPPLTGAAEPATRSARRVAGRQTRAARWLTRHSDGKLQLVSGLESLAGCGRADLVALAAAADLVEIPEGTVLAEGRDLAHWWWMPIEGWLLLSGQGKQAVTIPAGWSWMAPARQVPIGARLTALRGGRMLTAAVPSILGALDEHPRLAEAISSTLVVASDV